MPTIIASCSRPFGPVYSLAKSDISEDIWIFFHGLYNGSMINLFDKFEIMLEEVEEFGLCVLSETCTKYNDDIHKITHPHLPKQFSEP
jgi:hypothetical protein